MAGSGTAHLRDPGDVLLRVEHLTMTFSASGGATVSAVSDVSFDIAPGETLGLVGESGCGKTTTGRAVVGLTRPSSGSIRFAGQEVTTAARESMRRMRAQMQMIFQDPVSSLNPRMRVRDIVAEPLDIWQRPTAREREQRVAAMLEVVGLDYAATWSRRPHEFSGGQCQRISIARALMLDPQLLICDEPVSSLDVSVQAQILNLLEDMKDRYGLTMLFISHDLAVVKNVSDRVLVMYLGKVCEIAASEDLYRAPAHPYTAALLSAIPVADPDLPRQPEHLAGDVPSPVAPPTGCRFRTRCQKAQARCTDEEPELRPTATGHWVACHFPNTGHPGVRAEAKARVEGPVTMPVQG